MSDETYIVTIKDRVYELRVLSGMRQVKLGFLLQKKLVPVISSALLGNSQLLNESLTECLEEEQLYEIMMELIGIHTIKCNGKPCDVNTTFNKRTLDLYQLAYEAIKENYEDFFSLLSGLKTESGEQNNILDLIQMIKSPGLKTTNPTSPSSQTEKKKPTKPSRVRDKQHS